MKKITFLLIAIIVTGLSTSYIHLGLAQTATPVNGIITQDIAWTKTNSPYNLTGPLGISQGLTLTVQPGVTVNLNGYFIQVNGTLSARGSNADLIHFNNGQYIVFSQPSTNWNEQMQSGNIIENAVIDSVYIATGNAAPKLNKDIIIGSNGFGLLIQGSPTISNSTLSVEPTMLQSKFQMVHL